MLFRSYSLEVSGSEAAVFFVLGVFAAGFFAPVDFGSETLAVLFALDFGFVEVDAAFVVIAGLLGETVLAAAVFLAAAGRAAVCFAVDDFAVFELGSSALGLAAGLAAF